MASYVDAFVMHRDQVNAKVMKDPWITEGMKDMSKMPFDPRRMIYGGFRVSVDV